jgi:hypothetical protein
MEMVKSRFFMVLEPFRGEAFPWKSGNAETVDGILYIWRRTAGMARPLNKNPLTQGKRAIGDV